ncbi:hypothetical protein F5X68DRAFT_6436 [Plectosphaerella plurivora]|uniref:Uncharacterized protein n=1 Tax=Plectosphaerella plurivora TaxID=936078 RepID=A0A9P9A8T7_9PEZI|nr:hypothetical protein F5X68DRAFT_6436 [Plectosphaerella plurivora]
MDESPLIKAHEHARAASAANRQAETTVAVNEHALAAGEFANAARTTTSIDALRTLKLLENYHLRLAELMKQPHEQKPPTNDTDADTEVDEKQAGVAPEAEDTPPESHSDTKAAPAPQQKKISSRPMTSSIASNLASARGIRARNRGDPVPPSVTSDPASGNLEVSPRRENSGSRSKMKTVLDHSRPAWVPPDNSHRRKELEALDEEETPAPVSSTTSDDNYSRFYNTFGGLFNKLSAPLAFAGLPLITEESTSSSQDALVQEPPQQMSPAAKRTRQKAPALAAEPELSKIYSKATMRAISGQNPSESFYVVPTSGHTMSYANILNYADKEKRRMEASMHSGGGGVMSMMEEDDDDFVDARELPSGPPSPTFRRRPGGSSVGSGSRVRGGGTTPGSKTVEELAMENKSLKEVLDKLSKRLHVFEASAQNSHLALAESMRLRRPGSPLHSSAGSGGGAGGGLEAAALQAKNKDLEEQMASALRRMEQLEEENQRNERSLAKYREKWEKLKAGAKARRSAQGGAENVAPGEEASSR